MSDSELDGSASPSLVIGPGFYFDGQDSIQLSSWNALASVVLTLSGRFVHIDGRVEAFFERQVPNTDRTVKTNVFTRGAGWLTDLSVVASGAAPLRGQTYVRVDVGRGQPGTFVVLSTLSQGYVTATKRVAYPTASLEDSLAGQGCIRSITGTNPAAGAQISEVVPTGARWRFMSMLASLVTDGNAATRETVLRFDDGTNVFAEFPATQTQITTLTRRYEWSDQRPFASLQQYATIPVAVPVLMLAAGYHITTVIQNGQVGDDWAAPQYLVEEFMEAA